MADIRQLVLAFGDDWARLYNRVYPLLLRQAWDDAADVLGIELAFDLENEYVQEVLESLGERIQGVLDTTVDEIQALVGQQAEQGWSLADLAKEIRKLSETSAPRRAMLIARTETASAYSRGSIAAWQASGVVERMEWLTASDEVCDICDPLNGTTAALGETFAGGVLVPAHPACRCALAPVIG